MLTTIAQFLASHALAAMMLATGLTADRSLVRQLTDHWRLLLRALAVVWIAVPILALIAVAVLRPPSIGALAIVVMAICPGVPLVLRKAHKAQGDRNLSILILIATAITALVMLPLWVLILDRTGTFELAITPRQVAGVLSPNVLLPYVIGRLVGHFLPRLARPLAAIARIVFFAGLAILAAVVLAKAIPHVGEVSIRAAAALALVVLGGALLGYAAGGPRWDRRISFAYAAALGNPALAIAVIAPIVHADALPIAGLFVILRGVALVPFGVWLKRQQGAGPRGTSSPVRTDTAHAPA